MHEPLHLAGTDQLVPDHITQLRTTARELRSSRRDMTDRVSLLARIRGTLGRRLISIGTTVAGHAA